MFFTHIESYKSQVEDEEHRKTVQASTPEFLPTKEEFPLPRDLA
jgi:hypothetical protein